MAEDHETADAEQVDQAVEAIEAGDLDAAEALLLPLVARIPSDHRISWEEEDGTQCIRFWDQVAFLHYVTWQREQGEERSVVWALNVYPRACFHLGYICVHRRQFGRALEYLERALRLEPGNPQVLCEKAQALAHLGRLPAALALFEQVREIGPLVNARDLALAHRGRGFVLIELQRLDEAEAAFQASLELEPDSRLAINELEYIAHLRQGGARAGVEAVPSAGGDVTACAACGQQVDQGRVVSVDGRPVLICDRCHRKLTKRWWQFWR
jgi:tetratricopeptide (TPR) repeat protein